VTRLKDPEFLEQWPAILDAAASSPYLMKSGWFQLEYLVRNDHNFVRVLNNEWSWADERADELDQKNKGMGIRKIKQRRDELWSRYGLQHTMNIEKYPEQYQEYLDLTRQMRAYED